MIEFRDYQTTDRETVIDLLGQGRPEKYSAVKEAIFDWQFAANPHIEGGAPFVVGTVDGEVVALNGYMPVKLRYEGQPSRGSWSCDTFVSSKYRGKGFGKELIRRVTERAPIMLGYGISDMSDPIFEKFAWILHSGLTLCWLHVGEPGFKGAVKNLQSKWLKLRHRRSSAPRFDVAPHDEEFGPEVDDLWQRSALTHFSAVERDAAYLNWKYRRHPLHRYEWVAARERNALRGILITRYDPTTSVLVDYCGPADDLPLLAELVAVAVRRLVERGTIRVQCETTLVPLLQVLIQQGFRATRYHSRFRVRSNLAGDQRQMERWLVMPGDSDGDMITDTTRIGR